VSEADQSTLIRFICVSPAAKAAGVILPGLVPVAAERDGTADALPVYSDHWVSNVFSRTGFLSTLNDVVGFTPKVNFNAGVVAAGEAQIESTVTGNTSSLVTSDPTVALTDQSQVYLPTNNALSEAGHVIMYLNEMGQGVQHIASRCSDIVTLISRIKFYHAVTGSAFTFLNIPRSYYGRLSVDDLCKAADPPLPTAAAAALLETLAASNVVVGGSCNLDVTDGQVRAAIAAVAPSDLCSVLKGSEAALVAVVKKSRYSNLYSLLRENLSEAQYINIVRNKILVDIQGKDVLYQIFSGNVLQRVPGQESPFVEFIQRVCDKKGKSIRPGCGGFGIRNFLTLFLSIEVSKAMSKLSAAAETGDQKTAEYQQKRVDLFTEQLNVSNPILTRISDAMTAEGEAKKELEQATTAEGRLKIQERVAHFRELKEGGNKDLMALSSSCNDKMRAMRLQQE